MLGQGVDAIAITPWLLATMPTLSAGAGHHQGGGRGTGCGHSLR